MFIGRVAEYVVNQVIALDNEKFQELVLKRFEMLDLIAAQVGKLTVDVEEIKKTLPTLATKEELGEVKSEVDSIKAIVVRIENDHGQKLGALLDGYKQTAERLDRHEAIISKKY